MAKEFFNKEYMLENTVPKPSRMSFRDLEGKQVDKLTVLGWAGIINGQNMWWCQCSCDRDKFFRVAATSLAKSLTTSCGCNYKNNGAMSPKDMSWAQQKVDSDRWQILSYGGMNYPASIVCLECDTTTKFDTFYSFLQRGSCPTCESAIEAKRRQYVEDLNYTYLGYDGYKDTRVRCNNCQLEVSKPVGSLAPCLCSEGKTDGQQCCVYIMKADEGLYKIGLSVDHIKRLGGFKTNDHVPPLTIVDVQWFHSLRSARAIESLYHRELKEYNYQFKESFDGHTEYFQTELDNIYQVREKNRAFFDSMEVEAPKRKEFDFANHGICFEGVWYPTKKELAEDYNKKWDTVREHIVKGLTLEEALLFDHLTYYDYKGERLTSREIYDKYQPDCSYTCFKSRIQKNKGNIEATLTVQKRIRAYFVDGVKMTPAEIATKYGYPIHKFRKLGRELHQFLVDNLPCDVKPAN